MTAIALKNTDWLMRLLAPQNNEVKLDIINRLSASLLSKAKKGTNDMSFFNGLTGAWADGISPEKETKTIRDARVSGMTRIMADF